jgi:hypothetical protein
MRRRRCPAGMRGGDERTPPARSLPPRALTAAGIGPGLARRGADEGCVQARAGTIWLTERLRSRNGAGLQDEGRGGSRVQGWRTTAAAAFARDHAPPEQAHLTVYPPPPGVTRRGDSRPERSLDLDHSHCEERTRTRDVISPTGGGGPFATVLEGHDRARAVSSLVTQACETVPSRRWHAPLRRRGDRFGDCMNGRRRRPG